MSRRSGDVAVAADANGAHLRNMQMQALILGLNAERLSKLKGFVVDKGPELLGDLFCPWAKWTLILLTSLIDSDDGSLKLFIAHIFGMESPRPIKSPLQLIVSAWHTVSEEALRNVKCMTELRTDALVVCRAMIMMSIMVIGDIGWKWLIGFHIGLFVAQTNLQFSKEAPHLFFHAVHVFLYMLEAVAPTFFCRFLLPIVGSVFAISLHSLPNGLRLTTCMFLHSVFVLFFYIPIWFGVCVMFAIFARVFAVDHDLGKLTACAMFMFTSLCSVHLVVYASGGGYCGALIVFLCPIVFLILEEDQQGVVRPLPLVCALISCLYTPFWVGLCFTSMVIFTLAAANDNVKAILWWFVSFAALHLLSYAFSRNFSVVAMCFMGSYFSYGCIL